MRRRPALLVALALVGAAQAHEIEAQRVSVVQRDALHLSLNFQLRYAEWLQRTLAPRSALPAFIGSHAAMPQAELQAALQQAQRRAEAATRLVRADGRVLSITSWRWPDAARVQAALQQLTMQTVVAPGEHLHEEVLTVQAEVLASAALDTVQLQLPTEWQPMLVVWYRPQQAWARPGAPPLKLRFP